MKGHWKSAVISAAASFVLSILIGIVSGVDFGIIILRGLLVSLVMAFVVWGAQQVFSMYLKGDEAAHSAAEQHSGGVNIIVEGDESETLDLLSQSEGSISDQFEPLAVKGVVTSHSSDFKSHSGPAVPSVFAGDDVNDLDIIPEDLSFEDYIAPDFKEDPSKGTGNAGSSMPQRAEAPASMSVENTQQFAHAIRTLLNKGKEV